MTRQTINYNRIQKNINLNKIYSILKEIEHQIDDSPQEYADEAKDFNKFLIQITKDRSKLRKQEFNLIFSNAENYYLEKNFTASILLIELAESLADRSGFQKLYHNALILRKKVERSLEYTKEIESIDPTGLMQIAPIIIQKRSLKIDSLLEEVNFEAERQDSIHPEIKGMLEKAKKSIDIFMKKYNISPIDAIEAKSKSFWTNTRSSIDLKSKEMKLNRLLSAVEKAENFVEKQELLDRTYKFIQENPNYFSVHRRQEILDFFDEINQKIEKIGSKSEGVIEECSDLIKKFKFTEASQNLLKYRKDLEMSGMEDKIYEVDELMSILTVNQSFMTKIKKVERVFETNDVLGAKTALLHVQNEINSHPNPSEVLPEIHNYVSSLRTQLKGNKIPRKKSNSFDPYRDSDANLTKKSTHDLFQQFKTILSTQKEISKDEMAEKLKLSSNELFNKLIEWKELLSFESKSGIISLVSRSHQNVIKKTSKVSEGLDSNENQIDNPQKKVSPKGKSKKAKSPLTKTTQKEQDALDALDDLLDEDF